MLVLFCVLASCRNAGSQAGATGEPQAEVAYTEVGAAFSGQEVKSREEIGEAYNALSVTDSLMTAFRAEVLEVCQAKGCWMRLQLPGQEAVMVRFKDYGFFVPKDIAGKTVEVEGLAFISEVSEEERRHLAEDGGATAEELKSITGPETSPGFEASGVRILQ